MNKAVLLLLILILWAGVLVVAGCKKVNPPVKAVTPEPPSSETPVGGADEEALLQPAVLNTMTQDTLYYAYDRDIVPNESHSHTWVRSGPGGALGMVYRESAPVTAAGGAGQYTDRLILKTLLPDGTVTNETVAAAPGTAIATLVYDSKGAPHVFSALSTDSDQYIHHYTRDPAGGWNRADVTNFAGEKGRYLYELTSLIDADDAVHLLALIIPHHPQTKETRQHAHIDSHIIHLTNKSGAWQRETVVNIDTVYIQDGYLKAVRRYDMTLDGRGHLHIAYSALRGPSYNDTLNPSEMHYATNKTGQWVTETVREPWDDSCEAGMNPSIAVDSANRPYIAYMVMDRVPTLSAMNSQLTYSLRSDNGQWEHVNITDTANGYFGTDNGHYTGSVPHLVMDVQDHPHILYSDIASSHYGSMGNVLNAGQLRYAHYDGAEWKLKIFYRQEEPIDYYNVEEILGMCLIISRDASRMDAVTMEFISYQGQDTYNLLHFKIR